MGQFLSRHVLKYEINETQRPIGVQSFLVAIEYDVNVQIFVAIVIDFGYYDNWIKYEFFFESVSQRFSDDIGDFLTNGFCGHAHVLLFREGRCWSELDREMRNPFITSSPKWLMTFTAKSFCGYRRSKRSLTRKFIRSGVRISST